MGAVTSTPRLSPALALRTTADYLIGSFVGERRRFLYGSDFWQKNFSNSLSNLHWPTHRVQEACKLFDQNIESLVMHNVLKKKTFLLVL
ncbi:hypothetical protein NC652_024409 [Populus alba x Populus x berolinensis]|nr:hypothetical protein NC652_024409 [Populus alba x Populus x berolinensis]